MASYYIRPGGSDLNNGLSHATAWQSTAKITSGSFSPGDEFNIERGGSYDVFNPPTNGTSGNTIKFMAYGSGDMPKFHSFVTIPSWSSIGGGLYTYTDATFSTPIKIVKIDSSIKGKGRFPSNDYFCRISNGIEQTAGEGGVAWVESASGIDPPDWHVSLPATDYTGAQICIRKNHYNYHVAKIDSVSSGRLYYGSDMGAVKGQYEPIVGFGFFIQNHISCLTSFGDWMYNESTKTITMYFGAESPASHTVEVAKSDNGLLLSGKNFLEFKNLDISGWNGHGASHSGCSNITWEDCVSSYCGGQGIHFSGNNNYCTVKNSELFNNHGGGSYADYGAHHMTMEDNWVHDIALVIGGSEGYGNADTRGVGLTVQSGTGNSIKRNRLHSIGFNGVVVNGNAFKASDNIIEYYNLNKTDGAGIYCYKGTTGPNITIRGEIKNNRCLHGIGYPNGTNEIDPISFGIYADDNMASVDIEGNVCAYNATAGIYLHNTVNILAAHNLLFGNKRQFNMDQGNGMVIRDTVFRDNKLFCVSPYQTFGFAFSSPMDVDQFGYFDNNEYYYVENHIGRFGIYDGVTDEYNHEKTFEEWKLAIGGEMNSIYSSYQNYYPESPTILDTLFDQSYPSSGSQVGSGAGQFIDNSAFSETWESGKAVLTKVSGGKQASYMPIGDNVNNSKVYLVTLTIDSPSEQNINIQPEHTFEDSNNHSLKNRITATPSTQTIKFVLEDLTTFASEKLLWMADPTFNQIKIDSIKMEEISPFIFESDIELICNTGTSDFDYTYPYNMKDLGSGIIDTSFTLSPGEFAVLQKTTEPVTPSGPEEEFVIKIYAKLIIV